MRQDCQIRPVFSTCHNIFPTKALSSFEIRTPFVQRGTKRQMPNFEILTLHRYSIQHFFLSALVKIHFQHTACIAHTSPDDQYTTELSGTAGITVQVTHLRRLQDRTATQPTWSVLSTSVVNTPPLLLPAGFFRPVSESPRSLSCPPLPTAPSSSVCK